MIPRCRSRRAPSNWTLPSPYGIALWVVPRSPHRHRDRGTPRLRPLAAQVPQRCAAVRLPTVSVCLITKNAAENLPRVIGGVQGLATEIIVVDTGWADDTVKVARRLGARVEFFEWVDDFAAARN